MTDEFVTRSMYTAMVAERDALAAQLRGRGETVNAEGLNPVHSAGSTPAGPTITEADIAAMEARDNEHHSPEGHIAAWRDRNTLTMEMRRLWVERNRLAAERDALAAELAAAVEARDNLDAGHQLVKATRQVASHVLQQAKAAEAEVTRLTAERDALAAKYDAILTSWAESKAIVATLRKSLGQASDELYGDPEARIGGWKERAIKAEAESDRAILALTQLAFMGRTSGGVAGRDEGLCAACDEAEAIIAQHDSHADAESVWMNAFADMSKARDRLTAQLAAAHGLQARAEFLVEVLEIIAGERQCMDNLMSHAEIARAALARTRGRIESGSPARKTTAATPEPQTVAQGGEQATVAAAHGLLARAERAEAALRAARKVMTDAVSAANASPFWTENDRAMIAKLAEQVCVAVPS